VVGWMKRLVDACPEQGTALIYEALRLVKDL
jgi:hypothetical protein